MSESEKPIHVFDEFGRELFIPRETWRTTILPDAIKKAWSNASALHDILYEALTNGFRHELLAAAEHYYKLDSTPAGACLWSLVLRDVGRLGDAEKVLKECIAKTAGDSYVFSNLAKVYAAQKKQSLADSTLWHALELDPNQSDAFGLYTTQQKQHGGPLNYHAALKRIAALPKSWRAQIWLARESLDANDLPQALTHYRDSLSRAETPPPTDLLSQMSGDLGQHGHLAELLTLTEPHFSPPLHGLQVGNNLIKAHLDSGHIEKARHILEQLYSLKRPDWKDTLAYWETEIAKARIESKELQPDAPLKITMLTTDGPIWIIKDSPILQLFASKPADSVKIALLGCTAQTGNQSKVVQHQMADAPGRLSRAVPLFLAEQIQFTSDAEVSTLTPWIVEPSAGFVLIGPPWNNEDAIANAKQASPPADYVIVTHLITDQEPWQLELRLLKTIDAQCLGQLNAAFPSAAPQNEIPKLANLLLALLAEHGIVKSQSSPAFYQLPESSQFANYLLRLEQLLAVRCAAMHNVNANFLNGPREIIDGNLHLCLTCPQNPTTRFLLAQTLLSLNKSHPEVPMEFKNQVQLLQKQKPLSPSTHAIVQKMIDDVFSVTQS